MAFNIHLLIASYRQQESRLQADPPSYCAMSKKTLFLIGARILYVVLEFHLLYIAKVSGISHIVFLCRFSRW